jgi:hypothetical protein
MKRLSKLVIALTLSIIVSNTSEMARAQGAYDYDQYDGSQGNYETSYQDFYDGLAPYGQWIYDQQFGYVWMPNVGPDFRPYYTNGYWAMTQYGNTWVSNYDWGWATFHYGRWTFDNYYGWLWIPDTQWAPAWVSWRSNYNYYGWAPMGPGVSINVSLGQIPVDWWVFLSPNYFYEPRFHRYCNNDWRFTRSIYTQTNYISYTYRDRRGTYYTGPRSVDYRRRTGRETSMFRINDNNRRGATNIRGNQINIYRPVMRSRGNDAPARIVQTNRDISSRPQSFTRTNEGPAGRQRILNQTPIENRGADRARVSPNDNGDNNRMDRNINQQNRMNKQVAEQENVRQRQLEQRDAQMIRAEQKTRSTQTEESNKQRMQQMRDAQIQRQREQEQNRQRMDEQRNQQRAQQEQETNRQRMQMQRDQEQNKQRLDEQRLDEQINQQRQQQESNRQRMQMQRDQEQNRQRMDEQRNQQRQQQREQEVNRQRTQQVTAPQREERIRERRPEMERGTNTQQVTPRNESSESLRRQRD